MSMPQDGRVESMSPAIANSVGVKQVFDTTSAPHVGAGGYICHFVVDLLAIITSIERKTREVF